MGTDLLLFSLFVLRVLFVWLLGLLVAGVFGVVVLVTFAGEGRYPAWVVYRYLSDGALDIRRPAHPDREPDVASATSLGEALAPRRVGPDP